MLKKRFAIAVALVALCAGLIGTAVVAEPGFINVNSTATKEIEPNRAEVSFYIETTDKTSTAAADKNKKIANAVIEALKPKLTTKDKDFIKTTSFIVRPDYVWSRDNKRTLTGYTATNSVQVVTSDVSIAGSLIDLALKAGATRVDSFNVTLDNPDKYCNDAVIEAVKDAKSKGDAIAKALGTSIMGVKSVSTSCSTRNNNNGLIRYAAKLNSTMDAAGAVEEETTPIETSKIKLNATVNASFNLK